MVNEYWLEVSSQVIGNNGRQSRIKEVDDSGSHIHLFQPLDPPNKLIVPIGDEEEGDEVREEEEEKRES